jgi:hypothetical protein
VCVNKLLSSKDSFLRARNPGTELHIKPNIPAIGDQPMLASRDYDMKVLSRLMSNCSVIGGQKMLGRFIEKDWFKFSKRGVESPPYHQTGVSSYGYNCELPL